MHQLGNVTVVLNRDDDLLAFCDPQQGPGALPL